MIIGRHIYQVKTVSHARMTELQVIALGPKMASSRGSHLLTYL